MWLRSQICTTKEQSERLLALGLKKETADIGLAGDIPIAIEDWKTQDTTLIDSPAWSLGRLLELCGSIAYDWLFRSDNYFENMVSCIEWMISKECFNKDYLEE